MAYIILKKRNIIYFPNLPEDTGDLNCLKLIPFESI